MLVRVTIDPRLGISKEIASILGMTPLTESGQVRDGTVCIRVNKHGLFRDREESIWAVTPKGLMRIDDMLPDDVDEL